MELNQELRKNILTYPTLNYNRISVLLHMYCVNGTGYHWYDIDGRVRYGLHEDDEADKLWTALKNATWKEFKQLTFEREKREQKSERWGNAFRSMTMFHCIYKRHKKEIEAMGVGLSEEEATVAVGKFLKAKEDITKRSKRYKRSVGRDMRTRLKTHMKCYVDSKREHFDNLHIPHKGYVAEWWARKTADRLRFNEPYKNEYGHGVFYPMSEGYCRISEISDNAKPEYIEAMLEVCSLVILYEVYQPNIDFVIPYFKQALEIMGRLHMGYTLNSIMLEEALEPALAKLGFDGKKKWEVL